MTLGGRCMEIVAAIGLAVVAVIGWVTQLVGLPGNWIVVVAAAIYAASFPGDSRTALSSLLSTSGARTCNTT